MLPPLRGSTGGRSWGRNVLKGEKAIRIIAPNGRRVREDPSDSEHDRVIQYFKAVPVFAYEQTEGKPLPVLDVPILQADEGAELYVRLHMAVSQDGVAVARGHERFARSPSMMGFYLPQERQIYVREAPSAPDDQDPGPRDSPPLRWTRELEPRDRDRGGERGVCGGPRGYGYDSGERSFPYISVWAKEKNTLRQALGTIQKLSAFIIDRVSSPPEGPSGVGPSSGGGPAKLKANLATGWLPVRHQEIKMEYLARHSPLPHNTNYAQRSLLR